MVVVVPRLRGLAWSPVYVGVARLVEGGGTGWLRSVGGLWGPALGWLPGDLEGAVAVSGSRSRGGSGSTRDPRVSCPITSQHPVPMLRGMAAH